MRKAAAVFVLLLGVLGLTGCVSPAADHVANDIAFYNHLGGRLDRWIAAGREPDGSTMPPALRQALADELAAKGDELNAQARSVGVSSTALLLGRKP